MYYEKKYMDYEDYAYFQGNKVRRPEKLASFKRHIPNRIKKFTGIFRSAKNFLNPGKVLCLGARTGCEVKAARAVGFKESIGIDLFPVGDLVVKGDWHNIPFPAGSFENVYTNSIDHCYDLDSLAKEVRRVLLPRGVFFLQTALWQAMNTKEDKEDYMEKSSNFLFWDEGHDLAVKLAEYGFVLIKAWQKRNWESFIMRLEDGTEDAPNT